MARLRWMENARTGSEGTVCTHDNKLYFDDENAYIYASASATLDLVATTIVVTGNQTISGDLAITGALSYGSETVSLNQDLQGTLTVGINDTGYDVKFYGAGSGKYWLWDENVDTNGGVVLVGTFAQTGNMAVTGTFTLTGAPSITGNVDIVGTLDVGVDNTGHDVKFYGATGSSYWLWDESEDEMKIVGSSDQTGNAQLTGTLTVGVDGTGHDVQFFGDSSTYQFLWDQNADTHGGVVMKGTFTTVGSVGITGAVSITGNVGIDGDITMATTDQINFNDTGTNIQSSANGQLDVDADVKLQLVAPTIDLEASTVIALDGDVAIDGAHTFATGTGAVALNGTMTIANAKNIAVNTTTGTKIGTATAQKLGFWNVTPIIQPAAADQCAAPAGGTGQTAGAYDTAAHRDTAIATINAIRTALVNAGIMKGAA